LFPYSTWGENADAAHYRADSAKSRGKTVVGSAAALRAGKSEAAKWGLG
jgi:hypothetical protein